MVKIIGLTGGIATGKSSVSNLLKKRNFQVIDADAVVHDLQQAGSSLLIEMTKAFGSTILHENGNLNRAKLSKIIFSSEKDRLRLERIVHPAVRAEFKRKIRESQAEVLFLDVPLLFESGFDDLTTVDLVISTSSEVQLERLKRRDFLTEQEAKNRISSQMPMHEKVMRADFVIDNNGTLCELEESVEKFLRDILKVR